MPKDISAAALQPGTAMVLLLIFLKTWLRIKYSFNRNSLCSSKPSSIVGNENGDVCVIHPRLHDPFSISRSSLDRPLCCVALSHPQCGPGPDNSPETRVPRLDYSSPRFRPRIALRRHNGTPCVREADSEARLSPKACHNSSEDGFDREDGRSNAWSCAYRDTRLRFAQCHDGANGMDGAIGHARGPRFAIRCLRCLLAIEPISRRFQK